MKASELLITLKKTDQTAIQDKPAPIRIDRSDTQVFRSCKLRAKWYLQSQILKRYREGGEDAVDQTDRYWIGRFGIDLAKLPAWLLEDRDDMYVANTGSAYHKIMEDYITELIEINEGYNTESLLALAANGPIEFQPDLMELAHRSAWFRIYPSQYFGHEIQVTARFPNCGPGGEDVDATCRLDLIQRARGNAATCEIIDFKSGWGGMSGSDYFSWQALWNATCAHATWPEFETFRWKPYFCRRGFMGEALEYDEVGLRDARSICVAACMQLLTEQKWPAEPGSKRCHWCAYRNRCTFAKRKPNLDRNPASYALKTLHLEAELKGRKKALEEYVQGHGPLELPDGQYYGYSFFKDRPTCGLQKGEPMWHLHEIRAPKPKPKKADKKNDQAEDGKNDDSVDPGPAQAGA